MISASVRTLVSSAAVLTLSGALGGCNLVLGINEPEELPWSKIRYYAWDGSGPDGGDAGLGDASADALGVDAASTTDVATIDAMDSSAGRADAKVEAGPRCSNVPAADGGVCGAGCGTICPLGRACLKDVDCASGRCFGARCTLPSCTNGMRDGQETDVDCGGLCVTCGPSRACRLDTDCTSRSCADLRCEAIVDASSDARPAPGADASSDAHRSADTIVSVDPSVDASDSGNLVDAHGDDAGDAKEIDVAAASASCDGECPHIVLAPSE